MMKKFLVLALVLGVVALTNVSIGGLILQLSVDGVVNGAGIPQEVTLTPSDTILVDVTATYVEPAAPEGLWLGIEPIQGSGEWVVGTKHLYLAVAGSTAVLSDGGYGELWLNVAYPTPPGIGTWANGTLMDVTFRCTGLGDVMINLYDYTGATVLDSILIHQVPEPITMVLLGLGGLFLRKR